MVNSVAQTTFVSTCVFGIGIKKMLKDKLKLVLSF